MKLTKCFIALTLAGMTNTPLLAQETQTTKSDTTEAHENIEHINVKGRAQTLYRQDSSSVATRTNTPIEEIPQSD